LYILILSVPFHPSVPIEKPSCPLVPLSPIGLQILTQLISTIKPVGAMSDWTFTQQETTVAPGTTLFLYTDGLDEAENAQGQMFSKERIREVLQATSPEPRTLITEMTEAVAHFAGDTEQSDDLTMLALQYV